MSRQASAGGPVAPQLASHGYVITRPVRGSEYPVDLSFVLTQDEIYLPIAVLVAYSFNQSRLNIVWESFTLDWYRRVWENGPLLRAAQNSFVVAVISTVCSVLLGTVGAWLLPERGDRRFAPVTPEEQLLQLCALLRVDVG